MREHDLRRQVVTEMHLRKWPTITAPCVIVQWVRTVGEEERQAEMAWLERKLLVPPGPNSDSKYLSGGLSNGVHFVWEKHSEGSSLTLFFAGSEADHFLDPARSAAMSDSIQWGEAFPGWVVRATRIFVCRSDIDAKEIVAQIGFCADELVSCYIGEVARLWSDFRIQDDGYGRLVVSATGAQPYDVSRLVQRLQELGSYRNRALLGLPVAKANWPLLNEIEADLKDIASRISDPAATDDIVLGELADVSIRLAAIATDANFRMSATAAYASLVEDRLDELECQAIPGFASLADFTQRRFMPAVRTCAALTERIEQLSRRSNQITSLLRTRIETRIENQNGELLRSMERSAGRQLRLQELVEGFSIIAITYYSVGLVAYMLHGLEAVVPPRLAGHILGVCVPVMLAVIWGSVKVLKQKLIEE